MKAQKQLANSSTCMLLASSIQRYLTKLFLEKLSCSPMVLLILTVVSITSAAVFAVGSHAVNCLTP